MPYDGAVSLFWIAVVAALSPLLAGLIPRRLVPEVVFLLVFGILIGPYVLGWAGSNDAIELIRELGLGMLFLLAGYEIEIREVTGRGGRRAAATWLICFVSALVAVVVIGLVSTVEAEIAVAIALTSTALGTLLPILRDNGLLRTPLGANVLNHGAYGEVGPVVAMAVLLGAHGAAGSIILLLVLFAVAVLLTLPAARLRDGSSPLMKIIRTGSDTTAQTGVRLTLLLLISLGVLALVFDLDLVLGAFAAGFVLRQAVPQGDDEARAQAERVGLRFPHSGVLRHFGHVDRSASGVQRTACADHLRDLDVAAARTAGLPRQCVDPGTRNRPAHVQHSRKRPDRPVRRHWAAGHRGGDLGGGAERSAERAVRLAPGGRRRHHRPPASDDGNPAGVRSLSGSSRARAQLSPFSARISVTA